MSASANKSSGRYNLTQLSDCVRLVIDSHPHRQRQEAMLVVIERTPGAPSRADVLAALENHKKLGAK